MKPIASISILRLSLSKMQKPKAFTLSNSGILPWLTSPCDVCEAYDPNASGPRPAKKIRYNGLWDTGASGSMITKRIAKELGLIPTGMQQSFHAQGFSFVNTYLVNVTLLNGIQVFNLKVGEGDLPAGIDMLIGMDIISLGDFALTHKNNGTVFSFQIPSTHEYDFVKQIKNGVGAKVKKNKK